MQKNFPFPSELVDPNEKKTNKFGIKMAKAIYHNGVTNSDSTDRVKRIKELRDYASNNQSINKYKPLLNAAIDQQGDTSLINIDWRISTPCETIVNRVVGDMINQDHKCQFNAISPYARTKYEADRDAFYMKMIMEQQVAQIEAETGVKLMDRKGFNPKDSEELELYMEMEYRQPVEIGMEEIVDFELYNNDWEKKVRPRITKDLVTANEGRARLYFDENNNIRLRYTDIANYYAAYSSEPDNSDVDYESEVIYMTIRDLKLRDREKKVSNEQWRKIAQENSRKHGNPYFDNNNYDFDYNYDDFRVQVLDFIFYTIDKSFWLEKKKGGRTYFDKKGYGYEAKRGNLITKDRQVSYEGLWIVNTEIILDYGMSKNMIRYKDPYDTKKLSPQLVRRYVGYKLNGKSIVEIMMPNIDNIQLLVLRKRHIISEINPTGVAIDVSGISDVMNLLKETDPMKIIQMYKQKGVLLFSRTDVNGDPANGVPIQELNSPFAQLLMSLDQSIMSEMNIIRENLGQNTVADGAVPDKDALVGIEKMRTLSSNNVTRELYNSFLNGILAPIGKVVAKMVQYKIVYGDGLDAYENIIGKMGVKSLEFAKDVEMSELGIKIEALPTAEELQDLLNSLNIALQNQEIKPEDVFEIKKVKNIKKAIKYLSQKRKKYGEEKMAEFQQKEQITAQREQASAMAAAEAEKIKQQAKAEAEIMKLEAELRLKKELDDHLTINKIKLIDRESYWDMKKIEEAQDENDDNAEKSDKPSTTGLGAAGTRVFSDPVRSATRMDKFM